MLLLLVEHTTYKKGGPKASFGYVHNEVKIDLERVGLNQEDTLDRIRFKLYIDNFRCFHKELKETEERRRASKDECGDFGPQGKVLGN